MNAPSPILVLALLTLASTPVLHAQAKPDIEACRPEQLSLGTDTENGNFDGMSHTGTLLVLRNLGPTQCRLSPVPQITFRDSKDQPIPVTITPAHNPFQGPLVNGKRLPMGHGPVVLPITLPPHAEATSTLYWVDNDVFDHGTCLSPATIVLAIGASTLKTPFGLRICAQDPAHLAITATPLALDPTPKP